MEKYSSDTLLAWASSFEDKAQYVISDRMWALTVIAQVIPNEELPRDLINFKYDIQYVMNAPEPSDEEFANWLNANSTVLEGLPYKIWDIGHGYIWLLLDPKTFAFITKTNDPPEPTFEPRAVSILKGSGSIPTLWLQIGRNGVAPARHRVEDVLDPELAHDAWLVHGLKALLYRISPEQAKKFLKENKKTIDHIRRSFYTSAPKYLGGGADGAAFDIGEGRVLKIFRDEVSYEKALESSQRLHKKHPTAKTEAMIYDVGVLGDILRYPSDPTSNVTIYYYIMEKMRPLKEFFGSWTDIPLPKILSAVATELYRDDKWKTLKRVFNEPGKGRLIRQRVRDESRNLAAHVMQKSELREAAQAMKQQIPDLKDNWLELYIEEVIIKYITGRTDLHMGNIGITNYGELRYYDPTYGNREHINI